MEEDNIKEEVKTKIMLHVKGLVSPDKILEDKCFKYLTNTFFDNLDITRIDEIDKFQITSAIFLSFNKGLMEEEDYPRMAQCRQVYRILYYNMLKAATDRNSIEILQESNNYFQEKLKYIIDGQIK